MNLENDILTHPDIVKAGKKKKLAKFVPAIESENTKNDTANAVGNTYTTGESQEPAQLSKFDLVERYLDSRYEFRYNVVSNEVQIKPRAGESEDWKQINEDEIFRELQKQRISFSNANLKSLFRSDFVTHYNAIQKYFKDLPEWDKKDHIQNLANHVEAKDKEKFSLHFKKALVRTVKQALVSGYMNKHCFVLIGEKQHAGKTTFIKFLCPPKLQEYYTDNFNPDSGDKDDLLTLTENIIINLDELSQLYKTEINKLKGIFSRTSVKVRKAYATKKEVTPRRASFWGSTNNRDFLEDVTGNVRWLCFEIDGINFDYSKVIDIEKVYAQAYHLFKSGYHCELTKEEIELNEENNKQHLKQSAEVEMICKYFTPDTEEQKHNFITSSEIVSYISAREHGLKISSVGVGRALKQIGVEQEQIKKQGYDYKVKGYYLNKQF